MQTRTEARRLGFCTASDMVSEVDFHNHLPPSVVFYTARLHQPQNSGIGTKENYQGLIDSAPAARSRAGNRVAGLFLYERKLLQGAELASELSVLLEEAWVFQPSRRRRLLITAPALKARTVFLASPIQTRSTKPKRRF
jgi:hypothetical protein